MVTTLNQSSNITIFSKYTCLYVHMLITNLKQSLEISQSMSIISMLILQKWFSSDAY
jgi:hypothetical protein